MGRFLFTVCLCWLLAAGAAAEQVVLTLTVGGDCVLGTREEWQQEEGTFLTMVAERGMDWPFRNLREIFLEDRHDPAEPGMRPASGQPGPRLRQAAHLPGRSGLRGNAAPGRGGAGERGEQPLH